MTEPVTIGGATLTKKIEKSARQMRRFTSKIEIDLETGCWVWTGAVQSNGYGRFRENGRGSKVLMAHRFAYEALVGPIPAGWDLDHKCRNRACVNPKHHTPMPHRDNAWRANSLRFHQMEPDALTADQGSDESPF